MKTGSKAALVSMFPVASLLALVWKFPFPMFGYAQGLQAALMAPVAAIFFGVLGGFLVVPALGAAIGALPARSKWHRSRPDNMGGTHVLCGSHGRQRLRFAAICLAMLVGVGAFAQRYERVADAR